MTQTKAIRALIADDLELPSMSKEIAVVCEALGAIEAVQRGEAFSLASARVTRTWAR